MKWIGASFALLFILAIYYTIKISSVVSFKDAVVIRKIETNPEYRNELDKFNILLQKKSNQQINGSKKLEEITDFVISASIQEVPLPDDYKYYLAQGESERAIFQYLGLWGQRLSLAALKEELTSYDWNRDYLLKKINDVLEIPIINSDPILRNKILLSMATIPEIKNDAQLLLKDSVTDLSLLYIEFKNDEKYSAETDTLRRQLLETYILLGEKDPNAIVVKYDQMAHEGSRATASLPDTMEEATHAPEQEVSHDNPDIE